MKQTVEDDKVKDKISADEVKTICDACDEAIKWLDNNQTAEKVNIAPKTLAFDFNGTNPDIQDEFQHQKKELEKVCTPIITKMYQGAGGGMPGGMPDMSGAAGGDSAGASAGGPTIEEVD